MQPSSCCLVTCRQHAFVVPCLSVLVQAYVPLPWSLQDAKQSQSHEPAPSSQAKGQGKQTGGKRQKQAMPKAVSETPVYSDLAASEVRQTALAAYDPCCLWPREFCFVPGSTVCHVSSVSCAPVQAAYAYIKEHPAGFNTLDRLPDIEVCLDA